MHLLMPSSRASLLLPIMHVILLDECTVNTACHGTSSYGKLAKISTPMAYGISQNHLTCPRVAGALVDYLDEASLLFFGEI